MVGPNPWDNDPVVGAIPASPPLGGRPIIRKGADPVKPDLPQGWRINPQTGGAERVPGLPSAFTEPKPESKTTFRRMTSDEKVAAGIDPALPAYMGSDGLPKVPDGAKPPPSSKEDLQATAFELRNVIDKAFQARELSRKGWFSTGFGADIAKKIGGTSAANVADVLNVINSNTAFDRLQKMREASPTGGALGAISERELDLLKSTIAPTGQGQSDEQFQQAMQQVAEAYGRVLAKLPGGRAMMIQRGWLPKSSSSKPSAGQSNDGWGKATVVP